jgi:hypothetical protein
MDGVGRGGGTEHIQRVAGCSFLTCGCLLSGHWIAVDKVTLLNFNKRRNISLIG